MPVTATSILYEADRIRAYLVYEHLSKKNPEAGRLPGSGRMGK